MAFPSVLVVGAGPAGLAAALTLLKNGISVRIIEKDAQHHHGERGPGIMPRTLEIEHFLGVGDDVKKAGARSPFFQVHDANDPHRIIKSVQISEELEETPSFPEGRSIVLGQWKHQAVLRKHVEALGGIVELGSALVSFKQEAEYVSVDIAKTADGKTTIEQSKFGYLIGADGGHSVVRKILGVDFVGQTHEEGRMYIVDCIVEGIEGKGDLYLWGDVKTAFASIRDTGSPKCFQMIMSGPQIDFETLKAHPDVGALQKEFNRVTGRSDIIIKEVVNWQGEWRANIRMAGKFRVRRVFIVGDAAHTHSPTGGQGLNSSIQDAYNLGWKVALAVKGLAKPALLDSFEIERMPVIADMLKITTDLFKNAFSTDTQRKIELAKEAESAAAGEHSDAREQGWFRGRKLFQLDLNYRWSTAVVDERFQVEDSESAVQAYGVPGHDVRAGDRAPDAPSMVPLPPKGNGETVRLFDIFGPSFHTVLLFTSGNLEDIKPFVNVLAAYPSHLFKVLAIVPASATVQGTDIVNEVDLVLGDLKNHAREDYQIKDDGVPTAVLVRPDGMIGAFAISAKGVEKYLSIILTHA